MSIWFQRNVHAQPEPGQRHEVGETLRRGMHPDQPGEGEQPNDDGAEGIDDDKGQAHDGAVGDLRATRDPDLVLDVGRAAGGAGRIRADRRLRREGVQRVPSGRFGQVQPEIVHGVMLVQTRRW